MSSDINHQLKRIADALECLALRDQRKLEEQAASCPNCGGSCPEKVCSACGGFGNWSAECCSGARGCSCCGKVVEMGRCNVCGGSGRHCDRADKQANMKAIAGMQYLGSGPTR